MRLPTTPRHRLAAAVLVAFGLAGLLAIALAYADPALRKAVAFAGLGLC